MVLRHSTKIWEALKTTLYNDRTTDRVVRLCNFRAESFNAQEPIARICCQRGKTGCLIKKYKQDVKWI